MERSMYDRTFLAEDSLWWYLGKRALWRRALSAHLGSSTGRILDAGCGTGGDLTRLGIFGIPFGTDVSPYALRLSRLRGVRRLAASTVEALPFRAEVFDAVMSFDAISHEKVADDERALAEFHRVLIPGGVLMLNLPAFAFLGGPHDVVGHIDKRYARAGLRAKIERAGFLVDRITYWNGIVFFPAVVWRWIGRARMKKGAEPADDFFVGGPSVNALLKWAIRLEMAILKSANLPFGLSLFAVARRPAGPRRPLPAGR